MTDWALRFFFTGLLMFVFTLCGGIGFSLLEWPRAERTFVTGIFLSMALVVVAGLVLIWTKP